jgi:hypothetical protein
MIRKIDAEATCTMIICSLVYGPLSTRFDSSGLAIDYPFCLIPFKELVHIQAKLIEMACFVWLSQPNPGLFFFSP